MPPAEPAANVDKKSAPVAPTARVEPHSAHAAPTTPVAQPPPATARRRGRGSAFWIVLAILSLGAAAALALDRIGLIALG
jgi:hypothetical protein